MIHRRRRREFEFRIGLIEPLYAMHGYSGAEVEQNYAHLLELGQDLGETRQLLRILWGRAGGALVRCDFPRAYEYVGSFLELARQAGDATSVAQGRSHQCHDRDLRAANWSSRANGSWK